MESASALKKWYLYVNLLFEIKLSTGELMLLKCSVREYAWESLGQQGDPTSPFLKEISPEFSLEGLMLKLKLQYFVDLMWRTDSWKRPWCWERFKVGGKGDNRGWDGWMASATQWTWVWVSSVSWWWTGRPGMLQSMESQRVGHNWATELNWRAFMSFQFYFKYFPVCH